MDNVGFLLAVARQLGCEVVVLPDVVPSYTPFLGSGIPEGIILVDIRAPRVEMVRTLAHEIVHHLLFWSGHRFRDIVPPPQGNGPTAEQVIASLEDGEERVAAAVADMVLALPHGLQRNGRLAVPRGTVVRVYPRVSPKATPPAFLALPADDAAWYQE
jgi:hypothetical protein